MRGNGIDRQPAAGSPDEALWRRSRAVDMVEDDAARFLDLAGFADGRLDPDDRERVAEWLAGDPAAAGDVAAARALAGTPGPEAVPEAVVARALALVGGSEQRLGKVIPFLPKRPGRARLRGMAGWGGLVAAMAVAGWLGFTLGMNTSLSVAQIRPAGDDGFLHELLDPSTFMSGLPEDAQT